MQYTLRQNALGSCTGDHVAGTKSQHLHTHDNVAGTCLRDMLQRHVPATFPMKFNTLNKLNFIGHVAGTK